MKKAAVFMVCIGLVVSLAACSQPGDDGAGLPVSSAVSVDDTRNPGGAEEEGAPDPDTQHGESGLSVADDASQEPGDNNTQGASADIKALAAPETDPFPLRQPFLTAQIESTDSIKQIDVIQFSGPESARLTITEKDQIDDIWNMMAQTEITAEGANEANPATGGSLALEFLFEDGSMAKISMAYLVWLNEEGPYLFSDETSEQRYWDLCAALMQQ
ncbi:MAG: hypothetical protein LBV27_04700 [Oscillospiraceae bacterium]|jgi:hypothetical protein|nr:hypothetical protein [Oscillospiraceae bacterium]